MPPGRRRRKQRPPCRPLWLAAVPRGGRSPADPRLRARRQFEQSARCPTDATVDSSDLRSLIGRQVCGVRFKPGRERLEPGVEATIDALGHRPSNRAEHGTKQGTANHAPTLAAFSMLTRHAADKPSVPRSERPADVHGPGQPSLACRRCHGPPGVPVKANRRTTPSVESPLLEGNDHGYS
jgi:hypothetical protein